MPSRAVQNRLAGRVFGTSDIDKAQLEIYIETVLAIMRQ